jgi:hypothetical protein
MHSFTISQNQYAKKQVAMLWKWSETGNQTTTVKACTEARIGTGAMRSTLEYKGWRNEEAYGQLDCHRFKVRSGDLSAREVGGTLAVSGESDFGDLSCSTLGCVYVCRLGSRWLWAWNGNSGEHAPSICSSVSAFGHGLTLRCAAFNNTAVVVLRSMLVTRKLV